MSESDAREVDVTSPAVEIQRIIRTGTLWTAAGVVAPAVFLGPLLASGWRPAELSVFGAVFFWVGAAAAAIGLALLIWAGCPVLGFPLPEAYKQKVVCIHFGVVMNVAGMALCGLVVLLAPASG